MGDEFQHLFQAAAKLKSHQLKSDRPKFEKWPKYKQNSCFQKEEVSTLRKLPHGPRLEGLQALKADGNELFKKGDYFGALAKYESALSVVTFAVNAEPDWRNKSIKDSDLTEFDYDGTKTTETTMGTTTLSTAPGSDGQGGGADGTVDDVDVGQTRAAEVLECKVSCYLNLAAVYLKLKDWPGAIAASTDAISLAPTNAKAHFRRALARLEPLSSGAAEVEQGFHDLKRAAQLDPGNKTVARKLRQVTAQQRAQRERDRKNYSGFLHRPNSKPLYEEKLDNSGAVHEFEEEEEHQSNNTTSAMGRKLNRRRHGQQQANAASSATTQRARNGRFGVPEEVEVQFREIEMIIRELEASGDYAKVIFKKLLECFLHWTASVCAVSIMLLCVDAVVSAVICSAGAVATSLAPDLHFLLLLGWG